MPFKRMTIREQIAAKRELHRLRALERHLKDSWGGEKIAEGSVCDHASGAIAAAIKLGYVVVVRGHSDGKRLVAAAYRLGAP